MITIETLTEIVANERRPTAERARAAEALKFFAETVTYATEHPRPGIGLEFEVAVAKMMGRSYAHMLWSDPDDCRIESKTGHDGAPYRIVVSKKFHGPRASEETPVALPSLAVPAPVIAPSDSETKACRQIADRFSPAETARKLVSIDKEAAEAKANLSAVESIEREIANEKDTREKYEAAQQRLAELKSQASRQVDLGTF